MLEGPSPKPGLGPFVFVAPSSSQYDSVSDVLGWQFRLRWILEPGSDLVFVYLQNGRTSR